MSGSLLQDEMDPGKYGIKKFEGVIVFVGMSMVVASLGGMGWVFEKRESIWREGKMIGLRGRKGSVAFLRDGEIVNRREENP